MNYFNQIEQLPTKELIPGFFGKMLHLENFTMAYWEVKAGSILPKHSHIHEQVTNVISGEFEMTIDGKTQLCKAGDIAAIPSDVEHSGKAITDCVLIDVFQPVREDYRKMFEAE